MTEEYRIAIVITGEDKASGVLKRVGAALAGMGEIAGAILAAQLLQRIGQAIADAGRQAFEAVAGYERMGLALQNLAARESLALNAADQFAQWMRDNLGATDYQVNRYIALRNEYERLREVLAEMTAQGQDQTAYYQRLVAYQETIRQQIQAIVPGYKNLSRGMQAAAFGALDMGQALREATEPARELLRWATELAIESPFGTRQVVDAIRTAMAYGFVLEEAQKLTVAMGDFAAATGASDEVLQRMALALGQVKAKGRLMGQEILQLVNAGVPVNQILAEMGYTLQDVSEGAVEAQAFIAAFTDYMERNFGGAMKRQAETWEGLRNTWQDVKELGLKVLFEGILGALKPVAVTFLAWLRSEGLAKLQHMGDTLGDILETLVALADVDIGALSGKLEKLGVPPETREILFGWLIRMERFFGETLPEAVATFQDTLSALDYGAAVDWLETKLAPAVEFLKRAIAEIRAQGEPVAAAFQEAFAAVGEAFAGLKPVFDDLLRALQDAGIPIQEWSDLLTVAAVDAGAVLATVIGLVIGLLRGVAKAIEWAAPFVAGFIASLAAIATGFFEFTGGIVNAIRALLRGSTEEAQEWLKRALQGALDMVIGAFGLIVNAVGAALGAIVGLIAGFVEGVIDFFQGLYDRLVGHSIWPDMLNAMVEALAEWVEAVLGKFANFMAALKEWWDGILTKVGEWKDDLLNKAKELGHALVDGFREGILAKVADLVRAAEGLAQSAIDAVKGVLEFHSPPRVFVDIGREMAAAMALGMRRNQWLPAAAGAGMAQQVVQATHLQTRSETHFHFQGFGGTSLTEDDIVRAVQMAQFLAGSV